MNNLRLLNERVILGKEFRVYGDSDNPLFLAKDVAEWIDYNKDKHEYYDVAEMTKTVDNDEKVKIFGTLPTITNAPSPVKSSVPATNRWFLTEEGLYEVLMQSRKPIAKKIKKEVKVILKDIRKFGFFATTETIENMLGNPEYAITLLSEYKEEKELREQSNTKKSFRK